ncbi:alginate export family protein [Microbulbifer thermotolerans]|uniref:alginate export family protein n=1 Tax=Microbulbifer thermotolerans TaxID=252514 RepID=UPI00224A589A|nr:alginate export family protein [Microbulbifer thermotolerans]MCX2779256.1 alginate export family protein [Microbulbifer thermotolerans]MCX2803680.1 alginate export family protein [Microbulbifer thermotolerans]
MLPGNATNTNRALLFCATLTAAMQPLAADREAQTLIDALQNGQLGLSLRYRLESVDQAGFDDQANASTLRSRLSWTSGTYRGLVIGVEMDDVSAVGSDSYNSTTNGNSEYPLVADPEGTEVNRAYLRYARDNYDITAGRQRINLGDQRFVGGVGWRQNEQTFDGYRFRYGNSESLQIDYSYVYRVHRIFGEDSDQGSWDGDIHLFNATYPFAEKQKLHLFFLDVDLDQATNNSSRTLGFTYIADVGILGTRLSYARQSESGESSLDYSATYYLAELSTALGPVNAKLGYEILGSDNGVGFATPLATLHKFQGFADQFLTTPAEGVEDAYLGANAGLAGGRLGITYHRFSAAEGSGDWGSEWDLSYERALSKNLSALVKLASYRAEDYGSDTDKLWLQLVAAF